MAGGLVIGADGANRIADVVIEGGRIVAVAAAGVTPTSGARVVDAAGMIVSPGLVDSHVHLWQSLLRNVGVDWGLDDYQRFRATYGSRLDQDDLALATLVGALEAVAAGVTTVVDCSHNLAGPAAAEAAIDALDRSGIRAVFAAGTSNDSWLPAGAPQPVTDDVLAVVADRLTGHPRLTGAVCSMGPDAGSMEVALADIGRARQLGLDVTFPACIGARPQDVSALTALHEANALSERLLLAHVDSPSAAELRTAGRAGVRASVTPEVELKASMAAPDPGRFLDAGVGVGIGTDTVTMGSDLYGAMRAALLSTGLAQYRRRDDAPAPGRRVTAREVFDAVTRHGATVAGLDGIGALVPGAHADVMVADPAAMGVLLEPHDPRAALIMNGSPGAVRSVLVAGRILKHDGRLTHPELAQVVAAAHAARRRLVGQGDPHA